MAIIGALTIGMGVNTAGLSKGFLGASGLINQFGKSISMAGSGLGMLAADTGKFARGVAQDAKFFAQITGITPGIKLAGRAMSGFAGLSMSAFSGVSGIISSAASKINAFGRDLGRAGMQLGIFGVVQGTAAAYGIYKAVKAGSDMIENQNMLKQVFGDSTGFVISESKRMGEAFGSSISEFQTSAGMLGGIFKNMGYAQGDAAQLSVEMIKLAGDLSSLKNIHFDEALHKITSGLTGESEPLKRIGINLLETTVAQEAYRMGIAKVGIELTEQQKIQARLSSLTKQTADAHGDWARTADEVANATKGVSGRFENLVATLGEQLQPVAKSVLGDLSTGIQVITEMWKGNSTAVLDAASSTIGSAQQQSTSIGFLQQAVGKVADAWQTVSLTFTFVQSQITAGFGKLIEGVGWLINSFIELKNQITGSTTEGTNFFKIWSEDLKQLSEQQMKTFELKANAAPLSEGINKAFDAARVKTAQMRADLAKSTVDISKFVPKSDAITKAGKQQGPNTAASFGSSEAANAILKSRFGSGGSDKPAETTATNTTKMVASLDQIARGVSGFAGVGGNAMAWDSI